MEARVEIASEKIRKIVQDNEKKIARSFELSPEEARQQLSRLFKLEFDIVRTCLERLVGVRVPDIETVLVLEEVEYPKIIVETSEGKIRWTVHTNLQLVSEFGLYMDKAVYLGLPDLFFPSLLAILLIHSLSDWKMLVRDVYVRHGLGEEAVRYLNAGLELAITPLFSIFNYVYGRILSVMNIVVHVEVNGTVLPFPIPVEMIVVPMYLVRKLSFLSFSSGYVCGQACSLLNYDWCMADVEAIQLLWEWYSTMLRERVRWLDMLLTIAQSLGKISWIALSSEDLGRGILLAERLLKTVSVL